MVYIYAGARNKISFLSQFFYSPLMCIACLRAHTENRFGKVCGKWRTAGVYMLGGIWGFVWNFFFFSNILIIWTRQTYAQEIHKDIDNVVEVTGDKLTNNDNQLVRIFFVIIHFSIYIFFLFHVFIFHTFFFFFLCSLLLR